MATKIQAKRESGLTAVRLKWDPPVLNKKEGNITWQSCQVFPAARAFPWVNIRQVMLATRASQVASSSQTGRSITPRASPQTSQADSALPPVESSIHQAGNSQAYPVDSTLSQAESVVSQADNPQAGNLQFSPADNTLSQAESVISQASNTRSSQADIALHLAESAVSQASPVGSNLSQA